MSAGGILEKPPPSGTGGFWGDISGNVTGSASNKRTAATTPARLDVVKDYITRTALRLKARSRRRVTPPDVPWSFNIPTTLLLQSTVPGVQRDQVRVGALLWYAGVSKQWRLRLQQNPIPPPSAGEGLSASNNGKRPRGVQVGAVQCAESRVPGCPLISNTGIRVLNTAVAKVQQARKYS
jgi:hypothetical protein